MPETSLNIAENRRAQKWTRKELLGRLLWEISEGPLFRWTPRQMWGWRSTVLRLFGARIGTNVQIYPTARIAIPWNLWIGDNSSIGQNATIYNLGMVTLGKDASISQNAHICAGTHDFNKPELPLTKPPIKLEQGTWICADAFVGPGVTIGAFSIVGARGVVTHDVAPNQIVAGNPAKFIKMRNLSD